MTRINPHERAEVRYREWRDALSHAIGTTDPLDQIPTHTLTATHLHLRLSPHPAHHAYVHIVGAELARRRLAPEDTPRADPDAAANIDERLDEFVWLTGGGEWPERAARRVGYAGIKSVTAAARKYGRDDVLTILDEIRSAA